jgi:hypothetical protein
LVVLVILGAVVLLIGTGLLAFLLVQRHSAAGQTQTLTGPVLPAGARATGIAADGERITLLYEHSGGGQGLLVLGRDGRVLLRLEPLAP